LVGGVWGGGGGGGKQPIVTKPDKHC